MYLGFVFLYALHQGKSIIDSIDQMEFLESDHKWGKRILFKIPIGDPIEILNPMTEEMIVEYKSYKELKFVFDKIGEISLPAKQSIGTDGKWSIAYVKQIGGTREYGPMILRRLRKWSTNNSSEMIGPYSIAKTHEKYPVFAERLFKPGVFDENGNWLNAVPGSKLKVPSIWQGDRSAEYLATFDYDPRQEECDNDTAPDLDTIFGTQEIIGEQK